MKRFTKLAAVALSLSVLAASGAVAVAQETIKVGIIGDFTGLFAANGSAMRQGLEAYLAKNGNVVAGQKIELVYRDAAGKPADAARLAEELVVKENVKIIGGLGLSSQVAAVLPVSTSAKVPTLSFPAAAPGLTKLSPYFVRAGQDIRIPGRIAAEYAVKNGKLRGYTLVADYAPGQQSEEAFVAAFKAKGGQMVGQDRVPVNTVDFTPFVERIANANPDVLEVFVPTGSPAVNFLQALGARGLLKKVMVIGTGAEAEDNDLHLFNDSIVGYHSVMYMAGSSDTPLNNWLKDYLKKTFGPDALPGPHHVGAYDGMVIIAKMIESQAGKKFDGDAAVKSVIGFSFDGTRGPIKINDDRELVQNFYLRRIDKVDGKMVNVVLDTFKAVVP